MEFKLFIKDIERFVMIISILLCCAVGFPALAIGAISTSINNMFVRLGTDYEIRNGGYFESIKNSVNQFISKP